MEPIDVAVIGSGPAGHSAAINAINRGRSAVIISGDYRDSYLYKAATVENMPGMPGKSGAEILDAFHSHALAMGAAEIRGQVQLIMPFPTDDGSSLFQIAYGNNMMMARAVILTIGASSFKPFPGEARLLGRGVSYCATCDGMLYRGKTTAVIAKAPDALEEAEHLARIGCRVLFFASAPDLKKWANRLPEGVFEQTAAASSFEIEGEDTVSALIADGARVPVDGVFILRKSIAPDALLPGIETQDGYIGVTRAQETSVPGVFAAGDCTGKPLQIAKALGEGLVAALSADAFLAAAERAKG
jgi:thioredoxin reductase (NADPH)